MILVFEQDTCHHQIVMILIISVRNFVELIKSVVLVRITSYNLGSPL